MASIFTYDPDPPRVASPWLQTDSSQGGTPRNAEETTEPDVTFPGHITGSSIAVAADGGRRVVRLQAEPQEGPVEYKLHLLLRARRKFKSTSTAVIIPGSRHSSYSAIASNKSVLDHAAEPATPLTAPPAASMQQTRQHRLEQLTTQLLWRLQQSSPHHTSSATNIILPSLPEALPELEAPTQPAKLLHGLEESQGALYEIGVADDGTLVGLAEDEMQESLNNLRAMAACLGCTVEVLREEVVGVCEWWEDEVVSGTDQPTARAGNLVVVEAIVKPHLQAKSPLIPDLDLPMDVTSWRTKPAGGAVSAQATEQLRITLTGPTMSGKSTLLGTLTTSTLDNGKGKSRISMLKHRHEITTGITSSVTQELLGYHDSTDGGVDVINYASENTASWIDIHAATDGSRLVFISDSAGHPRYRRTTIRSLVGWAPHYTILCVPADDSEDAASRAGNDESAQHTFGSTISGMDLSSAQLELCLKLNTPLVIVVTKLDLASRTGLKSTLSKVLDALKATGRKPAILPQALSALADNGLQHVPSGAVESAYHAAIPLLNDPRGTVPIVLTSAVQGTGMITLHALLHELPIPISAPEVAIDAGTVFHIEDVYSKPAEVASVIVSGRLRRGRIEVGQSGAIGPFSVLENEDSEDSDERVSSKTSHAHVHTSRSFPGALRNTHLSSTLAHLPNQEWRRYKVLSIRNLRLPVHALEADEVGTIAIVPADDRRKTEAPAAFGRIRKGMVLADVQPRACRTFVAEFKREDLESLAVGNHVVVYIASVRASARVISARSPDSPKSLRDQLVSDDHDHVPFEFNDDHAGLHERYERELNEKVAGAVTATSLLVTLHFDNSKEFVMVGDQVLVMPGGGPGLYGGNERGEKGVAGLEGFVGRITETYA